MGYFIYCRISRDVTGKMAGVQRQEAECRDFAKRHGLEVLDVFTDNDISAYSGKTRPEFNKMMKRLEAGEAEGVISWHLDRLYRRAPELEKIVSVVEATGIQVRTVQAGDLDLTNATGRLMARISASIASHEVEHQTERLLSSQRDRAVQGRWRGGQVPFAYRKGSEKGTLEVDEEKAEVYRWLVDETLAGTSLFSLARKLNEKGIPRPSGKPWSNTALRYMLKTPAMAGFSVHKRKIVGKAEWPAVIDEDRWYALQAFLDDPRRRTNQGNERKWQGTGVYECGRCGGKVRLQRTKERNKFTYVCRECNRTTRSQPPVDRLVDGVIIGYLSSPENRLRIANKRASGGKKLAKLMQQRRELVARDAALGEAFADGKYESVQHLVTASELLKERIAEVDRRLAEAGEASPTVVMLLDGEEVEERWKNLTPDKRAAVIDELLVVTLLPTKSSPKFNPESVRIEWK